MDSPVISIIVPVLNEAALIGDFLRHLRALDPEMEIVVADGGSTDRTVAIARALADRVVVTQPGRAAQMNIAAGMARGEILWFLHADLKAPTNSSERIKATMSDSRLVGGCFRLRYPRRELIYRVSDSLGNLGVEVFGFALGDHGIFCRRAAFVRTGGYPDVPILEDAELYRRLKRLGGMAQVRETIASDPRTFEKWGRYSTTAVYFFILLLYVGGVSIGRLYKIYRRFHSQSSSGSHRHVALETA